MKTSAIVVLLLVPYFAVSQFYYPLETGNIWQYKEPPPPVDPYVYPDTVAGDTLMPNAFTYKVIRGNLSSFVRYYRASGDRVYEFLTRGDSISINHEVLRFDFSAKLWDTVSVYRFFDDTCTVTLIDTGFANVFGKIRRYKTFYRTMRHTSFYVVDCVADSLGIIYNIVEPGLEMDLTGAIINGVVYGQIQSVESKSSKIPGPFTLFQNYPNPFNPSTTIRYELPKPSHVVLNLFNSVGQEVARLVDQQQQAGHHEVRFDARNFPSGVYFYRLSTGHFSQTKQLVLIR